MTFTNYTDNWDYWSDPENEPYQVEEYMGNSTLAYSPSIVAASQLEYLLPANLSFSVMSKYVSRQYIDNTSNREYSIDPYFINDLKFSYSFVPDWGGQVGLSILVPNVLDVSMRPMHGSTGIIQEEKSSLWMGITHRQADM